MPRVKIDYVVSFSSEDAENPASNLLSLEVNKKKWLCSKGEPSCSVVLQLSKAVKINTVHVGVYHTALVEVLVGLSEKPNDPYQVLVPSCIFLSPIDSRRGEGMERVRSFSEDQLVAETRQKKWDRLRVVCSQPYNKHCKYGLSFIHIYEPESKDRARPTESEKPIATTENPRAAAEKHKAVPDRLFNLNVDTFSSDEDEFKPGELFRKHRQSCGGQSTESQIRQATSHVLKNIDDTSTKLMKTPISKARQYQGNSSTNIDTGKKTDRETDEKTDRQRDSLMYTNEDEQPHSKIDHIVNRHKDEKAKKDDERRKQEEKIARQKEEQRKEKERRDKKDERRNEEAYPHGKNERDKTSGDERNYRKTDNITPQSKKDRGESFVDRKDSAQKNRDKTPQYKKGRDDNASSSHSQDKGKDKKRQHSNDNKNKNRLRPGPISSTPHTLLSGVVFVLSGYENPRRAQIRDSALAMGARFERDWTPQCTHLICAFPNTPKLKTVRSSRNGQSAIVVTGEWIERCCERRRLLPWQWFATEPDLKVQHSTDDEMEEDSPVSDEEPPKLSQPRKRQRKKRSFLYSDDESDDQQSKMAKQSSPSPKKEQGGSSRDGSERRQSQDDDNGNRTDVDEDNQLDEVEIDEDRVLPDFFDGYTFSLDPALEETFDCQLLCRYVRVYGGLLLESSQLDEDTNVDYWLCADDADNARSARGNTRVRADWVWRCHRDKRLASPGPYVF